jgi:hypothetical protein
MPEMLINTAFRAFFIFAKLMQDDASQCGSVPLLLY